MKVGVLVRFSFRETARAKGGMGERGGKGEVMGDVVVLVFLFLLFCCCCCRCAFYYFCLYELTLIVCIVSLMPSLLQCSYFLD